MATVKKILSICIIIFVSVVVLSSLSLLLRTAAQDHNATWKVLQREWDELTNF